MTVIDQRLTRDAFIGGEWRAARSGRRFASIDPSTGEHFADVAEGGREDIDEAVRSAAAAFPGWRALKPLERGRILLKLAQRIDAEAEAPAALETRDSGKPMATALGDVRGTARYFEYYGGLADKLQGETIPLGDDYVYAHRRRAVRRGGRHHPVERPDPQAARSVAPALMTGNAVVTKPAEQTPLSCLELAQLAFECGVPALRVQRGPRLREVARAALVEHPLVSKVAFTGSVDTGRLVASVAAKRLIPVTLGRRQVAGTSSSPTPTSRPTQRGLARHQRQRGPDLLGRVAPVRAPSLRAVPNTADAAPRHKDRSESAGDLPSE